MTPHARSFLLVVLVTTLVGSVLAPAPLRAETDEPRRHDARLMLILMAYHRDPPPEALDFLGDERVAALSSVATDPEAPQLSRVRALSLLAREEDAQARALVQGAALDPEWPVRLRIAALRALANHRLEDPATFETLTAALDDLDPGVRKTAVLGLARLDTPAAREQLEAQRMRERHVAVRAALRRARAAARGETPPPEGRRVHLRSPAKVRRTAP